MREWLNNKLHSRQQTPFCRTVQKTILHNSTVTYCVSIHSIEADVYSLSTVTCVHNLCEIKARKDMSTFKIVQTIEGNNKPVLTIVPCAWEKDGNLKYPSSSQQRTCSGFVKMAKDAASIPFDN